LSSRAPRATETKNHADRIAFTVNRNGFGEIWLMNGDRTDRHRLTPEAPAGTDASGSTSPSWSPDGRRIVYMSSGEETADDPSDVEIYVMRADGDQVRRLTADRILDADRPGPRTDAASHSLTRRAGERSGQMSSSSRSRSPAGGERRSRIILPARGRSLISARPGRRGD